MANRLALGAYAVAYGDESSELWQAPVPTSFSIEGGYLTVIIGDGSVQVEVRDTETSTHYEVTAKSYIFKHFIFLGVQCAHELCKQTHAFA